MATGWQVPTDGDCTTLTTLVGGETNSGGAIKETGTTHWTIHNTVATNSIGFMVLLGGGSFDNGTFILVSNTLLVRPCRALKHSPRATTRMTITAL